jgi:hypothetical protein
MTGYLFVLPAPHAVASVASTETAYTLPLPTSALIKNNVE